MEKFQNDSTNDITNEPYQGPSVAVEAAGRGFLEHFAYAVTGLLSLGILAYVFHKPAASLIEKSRALGTRLKENTPTNKFQDTAENWVGGFLHTIFGDPEAGESLLALSEQASNPRQKELLENMAMNKTQGFGNFLITHTVGALPFVGRPFKASVQSFEPRTNTAIAVGGIAGLAGYIGGWLKAAISSGAHGNKGKKQHDRLIAELKSERERNDDLEKINDELHAKYVEVSSRSEQDTPAQASTTHEAVAAYSDEHQQKPAHDAPAHTIHTQDAHANEHHGKLHGHAHAHAEHAAHAHA